MKIPTSSATMPKISGSAWPGERSGASACTAMTVPTPSSSAAVARNARLTSSSVRREGFAGMQEYAPWKNGRKKRAAGKPRRSDRPGACAPKRLRALRLAFLVGRRQRGRTNVDRAGLRGRGVADPRRPTIGRLGDGRAHDTTGGVEVGAQVRGVLHRVGEIRLFGGHEVPEIRLHRSQIRLLLRVSELRNRDGGQNADDHHHDEKLDQGKALAVHSTTSPTRKIQDAKNEYSGTHFSKQHAARGIHSLSRYSSRG